MTWTRADEERLQFARTRPQFSRVLEDLRKQRRAEQEPDVLAICARSTCTLRLPALHTERHTAIRGGFACACSYCEWL